MKRRSPLVSARPPSLPQPENILLYRKGQLDIKIADFGLAVQLKEGEEMKNLVGTAEYVGESLWLHARGGGGNVPHNTATLLRAQSTEGAVRSRWRIS